LKDYDHVILWLDYFNKNLKVRQGRRVKREHAVFDPTITELVEAAKAAGYDMADDAVNDHARFPRRSFVKSGYVMLAKKEGVKKSKVLDSVSEKLVQKREARQKSGKK
jgi:signal recognition particle subunit SRP19